MGRFWNRYFPSGDAAFYRVVYYAPDSLPGQSRSLIDRLYSCECFAAEVLFQGE